MGARWSTPFPDALYPHVIEVYHPLKWVLEFVHFVLSDPGCVGRVQMTCQYPGTRNTILRVLNRPDCGYTKGLYYADRHRHRDVIRFYFNDVKTATWVKLNTTPPE